MGDRHKKFTVSAKRGVRGEAFFEALLCEHALPHRVVSPKDLGIDYICEWVHRDRPSGVLFAAQVKTLPAASIRVTPKGVERLNGLDKFGLSNAHLKIDEVTLEYWRGFGIPVYLFVVVERRGRGAGTALECYYKRTAIALTKRGASLDRAAEYYKVNEGATFLAFGSTGRPGGFARDLLIDHVRWSYSKGGITYPDPEAMGLRSFPADAVFVDLLKEYRAPIERTHALLGRVLGRA